MFGVIDVARGWLWHTRYRIRHFWTWRREGALCAAAAVLMIGTAQAALIGFPAGQRATLSDTAKVAPPAESSGSIAHTAPIAATAAIAAPPSVSAALEPVELVDDGITAAGDGPIEVTGSLGDGRDPVEPEGPDANGEDLIAAKLFDDKVAAGRAAPVVVEENEEGDAASAE